MLWSSQRYHFVPRLGPQPTDPFAAPEWNVEAGPELTARALPNAAACEPALVLPERFTPRYASLVETLPEFQVGRFDHPVAPDSSVIALAADARRGSPEAALVGAVPGWQVAAFALATGSDASPTATAVPARTAGHSWSGTVATTRGATLVGLEALLGPDALVTTLGSGAARPFFHPDDEGTASFGATPHQGVLARMRTALPPALTLAAEPHLSDVILLDADDDSTYTTLAEAAPHLLAQLGAVERRVRAYWEMYALPPADSLRWTLHVIPRRIQRSATESLGRFVTRAANDSPIAISATLPGRRHAPGHSIGLDLSALAAGEYAVFVSVEVKGVTLTSGSQTFRVQ